MLGGRQENLAVIAFAARRDKDGVAYTVIAIGTKAGDPQTWRIGALPLDEFRLGNTAILGNLPALKQLMADYGGSGISGALHDYNARPKKVVSNITRLAFLANGGVAGNAGRAPIVALDTQAYLSYRGVIDPGSPNPNEKAGHRLVSNLKFVPDRDTGWRGVITGFDVHGSVAAPMIPNGAEKALGPEGHDMRAALIIYAVQDDTRRSLWRK